MVSLQNLDTYIHMYADCAIYHIHLYMYIKYISVLINEAKASSSLLPFDGLSSNFVDVAIF